MFTDQPNVHMVRFLLMTVLSGAVLQPQVSPPHELDQVDLALFCPHTARDQAMRLGPVPMPAIGPPRRNQARHQDRLDQDFLLDGGEVVLTQL